MSTALTKREEQFEHAMTNLRRRIAKDMDKIAAAVPAHVQANTIVRTLFNAIQEKPDLALKCTADSIAKCLIRAATYGLEVSNGQLGHCYIVPYGDQAQLQMSYKGIKELVRRTGEANIYMGAVREGDEWEFRGQDEKPYHIEADDPNRHEKPLTHAYAFVKQGGGDNATYVVKMMSKNACLSHRNQYSKTWQNAVRKGKEKAEKWHEDDPAFPKMCMKTCVHALANDGDVSLSADIRPAMTGEFVRGPEDDIVDAVAVPAKQIEAEPEPSEIDEGALKEAVKTCTTAQQCDDASAKLRNNFPGSAQLIFDSFNAKREQIINAAKTNPAAATEPPPE